MLTARAPAKVNLTLHIRGRRADGLHDLESLVAFAGAGDTLTLAPGGVLSLTVSGPTARAAGKSEDNLILKAARLLDARLDGIKTGAFHLIKRLPVAAGLGGGSSDAAATLRLLAQLNGLSPGDPALIDAARATGSDVPVCLGARARMMGGAGEEIGPPLLLPPLFAVLVNPGVPVATAEVFRLIALRQGKRVNATSRALRGRQRARVRPRVKKANTASHPLIADGISRDHLIAMLGASRNDLEAPAIRIAPVIADALALLRACAGCRLARMSGSGATVFGLFDDSHAVTRARRAVAAKQPRWWTSATMLG